MSESEIVLPLDETLWDMVDNLESSLGIQVSEDKALDLIGALYDVYECLQENDLDNAKVLVIGLTALIIAAPMGQADKVWQELQINEGMKNFELKAKELFNEES